MRISSDISEEIIDFVFNELTSYAEIDKDEIDEPIKEDMRQQIEWILDSWEIEIKENMPRVF